MLLEKLFDQEGKVSERIYKINEQAEIHTFWFG